jgi:AraC-like DNA-binding protein
MAGPPPTLILTPTAAGSTPSDGVMEDIAVLAPVPALHQVLLGVKAVRFTAQRHGLYRFFRLPEWYPHLYFYVDADASGRTARCHLRLLQAHRMLFEICSPATRLVVVAHFRPGMAAILAAPDPRGRSAGDSDCRDRFPRALARLTALCACDDLTSLAQAMQDEVQALLPGGSPPAGLMDAADALVEGHGQSTMEEFAARASCSTRTMCRRFGQHVGMSPKVMSGIVRIRHAMAAAAMSGSTDWSTIALDFGFCDQAHFINTCTRIMGRPPESFLRNMQSRMALLDGAYLEPASAG